MKIALFGLVFLFINLCSLAALAYTYTWNGSSGTDWATPANWNRPIGAPANSIPAITDVVQIGTISFTSQPAVTTSTATCASITLGTAKAVTFTVSGTLNVNGVILQKHSNGANVVTVITGSGNIICKGFTVGDNAVPLNLGDVLYTTTVNANISQLTVNGNLAVISTEAPLLGGLGGLLILGTLENNAIFNLTNNNTVASAVTVSGLLSVVNQNPVAGSAASINVVNNGSQTATLKLSGVNTVSISNTTYGSIDFYVPGGGTGGVGVEYANNDGSTQTVYTDNTTGLNTLGLSGATSVYQNISFSGTGTKKINSGNLTISGDWSSTGSADIIDNNTLNPTIYFKGTVTQQLADAGTNSGNGVVFNNVYFQGGGAKTITGTAATTNGFSVSNTGILTMAESTTLTVGTLGKLTLVSDNASSATIATIPSGCYIKGNVNVQRYFKAGTVAQNYRNYRLLSSPVNMNAVTDDSGASAYTTLSYLSSGTGVFTGGPGGLTNGFTVANATPTIYLYNESLANINTGFNTGNFKGLTNITTNPVNVYNAAGTDPNATATIYAGNGYMLYYTGNNISNLNNKQNRIGGVYADPDNATTTAVGTLNQGNIPVKLWWNSSTALSAAKTGYNLVGNPYAATIDWDGVSSGKIIAANVGDKIYVFNYTSKNYGTYQPNLGSSTGSNNASRYIASGQSFFVVASPGGTLTFTEAAKTSAQPSSFGSGYLLMGRPAQAEQKPQVLRIKLAKDSINTDESLIAFEPGAKNDYEPILDADRLTGIGNVATLATYAAQNTQMLAINHLHSIDSATRVKLFVNVSGAPGINTLTFSGLETLDQRYDVFLVDHYKKDSLQINLYRQYAFNIRADSAASYGDSRFELVFHKKNSINYRLLSFTGSPVNNTIELKWKVEAEQDATGFTVEKGDGNGNFTPAYHLQSDGSGIYTWVDKIPVTGVNTYRLKQDDIFSTISYSKILSVNLNPPAISSQVLTAYPNPVKTELNVKINTPDIPGQVLMKVISSAGQTLLSSISWGNIIQQNVNKLLPGTYIVEVSDNATKKVIGRIKISKP